MTVTNSSPSTAEAVLVTSMMRSVSIFRWVTLVWAVIGLLLGRAALIRPYWAVVLLVTAAGLTAYLHVVGLVAPRRLVTWPLLTAEVVMGLVLLIGDGFVYGPERSQSLPWAWPSAGIAAVGVAVAGRSDRGPGGVGDAGRWIDRHAGLLVAALVGAVSLFTEVVLLGRMAGTGQIGAAFSKVGLWLVVGLLVGPLMRRLLRAERLISVAKAREDLGRELHDGVLQTLAVVQRRSADPDLAALAREQENTLRAYLSDARLVGAAAEPVSRLAGTAELVAAGVDPDAVSGGIDAVLRRVASEAERRHRTTVQVVVAPDCPSIGPSTLAAVAGAVTEALNNAVKHGGADRVTVFAEPADDDDRLFVSVHDNGSGFVVDEVTEGIGLSRSIRGRIVEQGGQVEIRSRLDKGTEVKLWVNTNDRR